MRQPNDLEIEFATSLSKIQENDSDSFFMLKLEKKNTKQRGCHPKAFCKVGVLKNLEKFTKKCRSDYFYKTPGALQLS